MASRRLARRIGPAEESLECDREPADAQEAAAKRGHSGPSGASGEDPCVEAPGKEEDADQEAEGGDGKAFRISAQGEQGERVDKLVQDGRFPGFLGMGQKGRDGEPVRAVRRRGDPQKTEQAGEEPSKTIHRMSCCEICP